MRGSRIAGASLNGRAGDDLGGPTQTNARGRCGRIRLSWRSGPGVLSGDVRLPLA